MAASEEQQKKILFILLAVIAAMVWFLYFFMPQRQVWSQNRPELVKLKEKISRVRRELDRFPALEAERARLEKQYVLPSVLVLPQEQLPELVEQVAQVARDTGVKILALKPGEDLNQLEPGVSGYLELPIHLKTLSGYHQLGAFIDGLEESEVLLRVFSIEISKGFQDIWSHQANIRLLAYLLPASGEENQ